MISKRKGIMAGLLMLLVLALAATPVFAQGRPAMVDVIIGFNSAPGAAGDALIDGLGGSINSRYSIIPARAATVPASAVAALRANPNVAYVEEDGFKEFHTDSAVGELQWGTNRIDAEAVWDAVGGSTGASVRVADLDTGIDSDHPDLVGNISEVWSVAGKPDAQNPKEEGEDKNGHGTATAGVIAATQGNGPVVGVAPGADIIAIQITKGSRIKLSDIVDGIELAVIRGAQVINMSFGGGFSQAEADAITAAYDAGIVLVASAGNSSGGTMGYPAALIEVIAASSSDSSDALSSFSSVGLGTGDLIAPGSNIYTTYKDGTYVHINGTSFSSPAVAGVAALVLAGGVTDTSGNGRVNDEVRAILTTTAEDIGLTTSQQGAGLVDAENAVMGTTVGDNLTGFNQAPSVTITSPDYGTIFSSGATISFGGTATDEDGDLTGSLVWTSSINDQIGTGASFSTTLSDGNHTITASVTDSEDKTGSASISITVGDLPPPPSEPTTVSVTSITYVTEGGRNQDRNLLITIELKNDMDDLVGGASVSIELWRNNTLDARGTGTTGSNGTITFNRRNAASGEYTTKVTAVNAAGLKWDGTFPANSFTK